jgi:hypothetical protein
MKKGFDKFSNIITPIFSSFPQLISLTIENLEMTIDVLQSFLSSTPSLIYLKLIVISGKCMLDGERWERFIQINLLQLDKFEFFSNEFNINQRIAVDFEFIIASFQTPFWTEHKKWFVMCETNINNPISTHLYTIPICRSSLKYEPEPQKFILSTCSRTKADNSIIMNNIKSLDLTLNQSTADDIHEKVCH